MKLGRLLVRGFQKRRAKKALGRAPPRKRKRPVSLARRLILGDARSVAIPLPSDEPPPAGRAAPVSSPAALPAPIPRPEVVVRPQEIHGGLSTESLVRPGDELRRSIEAFILDQRSPHTQRAYGKDLKRFVQFLVVRKNHAGPETIDRRVIIAYKDWLLAEKLEHTTVDRHLATLRSFFRWLVDEEILFKNPAEGVRFLNPKRVSKTIGFSDEEVVRILEQPNLHTRTGAQHYAVLMILFYCGLRRSELCALRTSSILEERGHPILKLKGKGNAERVIVMIPAVWNALRYYFKITAREPGRDQPLFSPIRNNRTGLANKSLDPSMIFYVVTKYAKAAGIRSRVSPHSCRATAISNARDHNVPDRAIQEFAGWASPDMITRYDKRKSAVENSAAKAIRYGAGSRGLPAVAVTESPSSRGGSAPPARPQRDPAAEV